MFADQEEAAESSTDDDQSSDDGNQHFDERSPIHEVYWVACDANRRNGPQILGHDDLSVKGTDGGVSGVVDDYRFFGSEKKELIEEITGDKDMYGLRKYRQDFPEPDDDMWAEHASEHYGIDVVGVHKIPSDEASERFNVDYSKDNVDPIYVPVLEDDNGNEVVYEPDDYYDAEDESDEPEDTEQAEIDESEDEPDFPADAEVAQEHLEEIPVDDLNKQERGALGKLRDPRKTNDEIAEEIGCSKNTVRKGLIKFLGEDGYEDIKERGKELQSDDYEDQMATDGGEEGRIAELEDRVERLESMFNSETLAEM
jgi:hypothetical protein